MVVFSLAVVRDPAVKYSNPDGTIQNRSPAYLSEYASGQNAVRLSQIPFSSVVVSFLIFVV